MSGGMEKGGREGLVSNCQISKWLYYIVKIPNYFCSFIKHSRVIYLPRVYLEACSLLPNQKASYQNRKFQEI